MRRFERAEHGASTFSLRPGPDESDGALEYARIEAPTGASPAYGLVAMKPPSIPPASITPFSDPSGCSAPL